MTRKLIAELVLGLRNNMGPGAKQAADDLKKVEAAADRLGKSAKLDAAGLKALSDQMGKAGKEARDFAAAMGTPMKWGAGFDKQLSRLKVTADELAQIKRSWMALQDDIKSSNDAAFRRNLIQRWRAEALSSVTAVRAAKEQLNTEDLKAIRDRVAEEQKAARELARQKEREARDQERLAREAARSEKVALAQADKEAKRKAKEDERARIAQLSQKVKQEAEERKRQTRAAEDAAKNEQRLGLQNFLFRSRLARDEQSRKDREARDEARRSERVAREAARAKAKIEREEIQKRSKAEREAYQERAKAAREEAANQRRLEREKFQEVRRLDAERRRIESEQRRTLRDISRSFGRNLMYTATGITGVYGGAMVARRAIEQGATYQREGARDYLSGMSFQETARSNALAIGLTDRYPSVNPSTMRMLIRETANTSVGMKGAEAIAPELAKSYVVLQSQLGKDQALESLVKFTRALDVMGRNIDPRVVADLLDAATRAAGVMGAEFKPGDMLQFAKYAKSAGGSVSNEFLATMVPLLSGDMGPSRLGTALGTGMASVLSNKPGVGAGKYARAQQIQMGIRNESGIISPELFATDPHRWAWEILKPALEKKGIDPKDEAAVTKAVNQMFPQTVADLLQKLIQQEDQYRAVAEKFRRAPSMDEAASELPKRDPFVAFEGVIAQWDRFTNALTGPAMQNALPALNGIASGLSALSSVLEANPDIAANITYVATGFTAIAGGLLALRTAIVVVKAALGLAALGSGAAAGVGAAGATGAAAGGVGILGGIGMAGVAAGAAGAAGGYLLGQGVNALFGAAIDNYAPSTLEGIADLKGQLAQKREALAGIRSRQHPSMAGAPNAEASRIEAEIQELENRISAGQELLREAGWRAGEATMRGLADGIRATAGEATSAAASAAAGVAAAVSGGGSEAVATPTSTDAASAPSAPGRASGGSMYAGQAYRVNEHQGEYVYAKEASQVMKQGAVVTLSPTFIIQGGGNIQETLDQIQARLEDMARSAFRDAMADYGTDAA